MNNDTDFPLGLLVGLVIALLLLVFPVHHNGRGKGVEDALREAFRRGHAVQCLGKEGYFWECEE